MKLSEILQQNSFLDTMPRETAMNLVKEVLECNRDKYLNSSESWTDAINRQYNWANFSAEYILRNDLRDPIDYVRMNYVWLRYKRLFL